MRVNQLVIWNRSEPGDLPAWVRWMIATAAVITVITISLGANALFETDAAGYPLGGMFRFWPPFIFAVAIAVAYAPRSTTSRFIRLAILLPLIQVAAMLVLWWATADLGLTEDIERTPMVDELPVPLMVGSIAAATCIAALVVARKRRDWIHAAVTIALANLLLIGIWLPIASSILIPHEGWKTWKVLAHWLAQPERLVAIMVAPPFVVACVYGALTQHAPRFLLAARIPLACGLGALLMLAILSRMSDARAAYSLYDNFVHVVLCTAGIAIVAILGLGAASWSAGRRRLSRLGAGGRRAAVIDRDGDPIVARLEITSWLRGPRVTARPFVATTSGGIALPVPGDSAVAMSLPLATTTMKTGESLSVLFIGDPIELSGYVEHRHGDGPFRGAEVQVPGARGVVIGMVENAPTTPLESMGLATWRPAVAYLIIITLAVLPGVLGMLSPNWR